MKLRKKFSWQVINSCHKCIQNKQVLLILLAVLLQKTKRELKILCRLGIQILFTEMSLIKLAFSMIWLMVNQKISQRHQGAGLFRKKHWKNALVPQGKNYYYFWKSNIPVINLVGDSRNMIKVSQNMSL